MCGISLAAQTLFLMRAEGALFSRPSIKEKSGLGSKTRAGYSVQLGHLFKPGN